MSVYLNGAILRRGDAHVAVDDRGFIFGDGCYEVWRLVNGVPFEFERHRARLEHGLRELEIARPAELDGDALREIAERLLDATDARDGNATFYVQVTRGAAPRTHYFPPDGTRPTVLATVSRFTPPPPAVRQTGAAAITVPDIRWLRCDLKTIQLLPNVLAKQRAVSTGAVDSIFVRDDVVTEGTHTNVFAVIDGVIRTHPLGNLVLPGVTREVVIEIASALGLPLQEEAFTVGDLRGARELFLTGTTSDVLGITMLDGTPVGPGRPGPATAALYDALAERLGLGSAIPR